MTDGLRISSCDGVAVVHVEGDIDIANAARVQSRLLEAAAGQPIGLVADLSGVGYLDSGGVRMLFHVAEQVATARRRFALVVPEASPLRRLVKITGLHEAADVGASLAECIERWQAEGDAPRD